MIQPFNGVGKGVSALARRIGQAFLFVGRQVERVAHFIGGAVRG